MQQVNRAFEVLSDPMKKKLYDRYGVEVLTLYENKTITEDLWKLIFVLVNQKFTAFIGILCLVIFSSLVLSPIFIGLRIDNSITWSWFLVLFPLYIVEIFIFSICLFLIVLKLYFNDDDDNNKGDDSEDNPEEQKINTEDGFLHEDEERKTKISSQAKISAILNCSIIFLIVVFQILLCLQLDQTISWNWWIIFAPLLLAEIIYTILVIPNATYNSYKKILQVHEISEFYCSLRYFGFILRRFYKEFFVIASTILIAWNLSLAPDEEGLFNNFLNLEFFFF